MPEEGADDGVVIARLWCLSAEGLETVLLDDLPWRSDCFVEVYNKYKFSQNRGMVEC